MNDRVLLRKYSEVCSYYSPSDDNYNNDLKRGKKPIHKS